MTDLEKQRLEDFKRILTYRLVTKIHRDFKNHYELYYKVPAIWVRWREHQIAYDKKIYKLIVMFNNTALSSHQVQSIFGKTPENKWIAYGDLIAQDKDIKVFNKGTICMDKARYQIKKRYQLPFDMIKAIFDDKEMLAKVIDAGSDYYTPRQRRLIFTQINDMKKNYHYMTKKEKIEAMSEEEKMDELLKDILC